MSKVCQKLGNKLSFGELFQCPRFVRNWVISSASGFS
jgi:hypothetical protein